MHVEMPTLIGGVQGIWRDAAVAVETAKDFMKRRHNQQGAA